MSPQSSPFAKPAMRSAGDPDRPTPTLSREQIAARIHQLMLREIGQGINAEQMLCQHRYARDVLLVCEANRGSELAALAAEFRIASAALFPPQANVPGHAAVATDWSGDTSGFGVAQVPPRAADVTQESSGERRRGWLPWRRAKSDAG